MSSEHASTTQVAANIADVNREAGETGSASAKMLTSARSLSNESAHLRSEVDKFFCARCGRRELQLLMT
jgi:methyl-accepting chemotaxis protein